MFTFNWLNLLQNWSSSWDMQSALAAMHVEFMSPVLFIYFVEPDPTQFGVSGRNIIVVSKSCYSGSFKRMTVSIVF